VGFLGGFFWVLLGRFFWAGFLLPTLGNGNAKDVKIYENREASQVPVLVSSQKSSIATWSWRRFFIDTIDK
jgi:hypothetical protein